MTDNYIAELEKHIEELKEKYAHLESEYPRIVGENEYYKTRSPKWIPVNDSKAYVYRLGNIEIAKVWINPNKSNSWAYNIYFGGSSAEGFRNSLDAQHNVELDIFINGCATNI